MRRVCATTGLLKTLSRDDDPRLHRSLTCHAVPAIARVLPLSRPLPRGSLASSVSANRNAARVKPQRGMANIPVVERALFFLGNEIAAIDLRPTGDARANHEPQANIQINANQYLDLVLLIALHTA